MSMKKKKNNYYLYLLFSKSYDKKYDDIYFLHTDI